MLINTAYVISYLPKDGLREKRLEIHDRQIAYWKSKGLEIVVYAQGYEKGDFRDGVHYIQNTSIDIDRPGPARNVLLKEFYRTDDDFCLLLDNDIILYEGAKYCDSDTLIDELRNIPVGRFDGIDVFEPLNPTQSPFSAFYQDNKADLGDFLMFKRRPNISGQSLFVRNFKKFKCEEFLYDDWFDEKTKKIIMGEDVEFGLRLTQNGKGVYTLMNAVRKDMGWTVSSWCKNPELRKQSFETLKTILPTLGVGSKNGKLDWAGVADKYNIPKKVLVRKKGSMSLIDMM